MRLLRGGAVAARRAVGLQQRSASTSAAAALASRDRFDVRHLGPREADHAEMLAAIGVSSMEELTTKTVPSNILLSRPLDLGPYSPGLSETDALEELRRLVEPNKVMRSMLGMGYHDCKTPAVILRNVLENPGWYTQYTPYQPEVSQGRLESLMNFQTMVSDLTAMEMCNSSLLDEVNASAPGLCARRTAPQPPPPRPAGDRRRRGDGHDLRSSQRKGHLFRRPAGAPLPSHPRLRLSLLDSRRPPPPSRRPPPARRLAARRSNRGRRLIPQPPAPPPPHPPPSLLPPPQVHPQTKAVMRTRAEGHGITLVEGDYATYTPQEGLCGALVQYPATDGERLAEMLAERQPRGSREAARDSREVAETAAAGDGSRCHGTGPPRADSREPLS